MRHLTLAISLMAAVCVPVQSSFAQSGEQTLNEFEKMIATLRAEQASNQHALQMLRDGTMIMAPIALETREGKLTTIHDLLGSPDFAQQVMGAGKPGDHPTWIKNMDAQYMPISKAQFAQYVTTMAIMRYLQIDEKNPRFSPRNFIQKIQKFVTDMVRQTDRPRDKAIARLEKQQAGVNASLLDLMKRRDALQEAIRNGTYRETEDASDGSGWARTWTSGWGDVVLQVSGNRVTGTFTHKDGKLEGELSMDGRKLTGRWTQAPTRKAPNDAGAFEFTLDAGGKRFIGKWWYGFDTSKGADGGWSGTPK